MVRHYKKKTNRGEVPPEAVMSAAREVKIRGVSLRKAARGINLSYASLRRYLTRIPDSELYDESITVPSCNVGYNRSPRGPRVRVGRLETPVTIKTEYVSESETEALSVDCDPLEMGDLEEADEDRTDCLESSVDQSDDRLAEKFSDEYEIAGWLYAKKLRSLDLEQLRLTEKLVADVLARAAIKQLTPCTSLVDINDT